MAQKKETLERCGHHGEHPHVLLLHVVCQLHRKELQRVTKTAEKVIGCPLPTLEELQGSYCLRRANAVLKDSISCLQHCRWADGAGP